MRPLTVALIASVLPASTVLAQQPLHSWWGGSGDDSMGWSVSGAGDVDADGFDDLVVGIIYDDDSGTNSGTVVVYSGADGSELHRWTGDSDFDNFGHSVNGAGDVDGDGFDDLIVGAPYDDPGGTNRGAVFVFSGLDGSVLYAWPGRADFDWFGYAVDGAGDTNSDGHADLVIGAIFEDSNGPNAGMVQVRSGDDGSVLHEWYGDSPEDSLGVTVSGCGDLDGDGFDDVLAGTVYDDDNGESCGMARAWSGDDGSILHTWYGPSALDWFGHSVSGAGDFNGDGACDVVVGAPFEWFGGEELGSVRVFSGADGSLLFEHLATQPGTLGHSVSEAGDFDGDGYDDIVASSLYWTDTKETGIVKVFSGLTGLELASYETGSLADWFGFSVSGAGDVNADGFDDLVIGDPCDDQGAVEGGAAFVFAGGPVFTLREPVPGIAGQSNSIAVENAAPLATINFVWGTQAGSFLVGPFCPTLEVDLADPRLAGSSNADSQGDAALTATVPASAAGVTLLLQAVDLVACEASNLLVFSFQ